MASIIDYLISGSLALIMFGVGLSVKAESFRNTFSTPRLIFTGLGSQMIGLPLLAFTVAWLSGLPPAFQVGIVILAACPGGTTSGFLTYLFKGNVALSISLTSTNSFITLITIPVIVNLGLFLFYGTTTEIRLPVVDTILRVFTVTIIPAGLGVLVKEWKPNSAARIEQPAKVGFSLLFATVLVVMVFAGDQNSDNGITTEDIYKILPVMLLINLLSYTFGFLTGRFSRYGHKTSFTLGIEVSMQNTTLAFLVGNTILQSYEMVKPALVYAMFSFATGLLFSIIAKKMNRAPLMGDFRS